MRVFVYVATFTTQLSLNKKLVHQKRCTNLNLASERDQIAGLIVMLAIWHIFLLYYNRRLDLLRPLLDLLCRLCNLLGKRKSSITWNASPNCLAVPAFYIRVECLVNIQLFLEPGKNIIIYYNKGLE